MSLPLKNFYQAGYWSTQVSSYFSKFEIIKLLASDSIDTVQKIYHQQLAIVNSQSDHWKQQLQATVLLMQSYDLDLPAVPNNSFDFFYWLDIFHREVMRQVTNESTEEYAFLFGYDFGYAYSHTELLRFITEFEILLPMELSYNKQTDHLLRNINSTQHRLESTAVALGGDNDTYIIWDQWKNIDALLTQVRNLNYMSVEHSGLVTQEHTLTNIIDEFTETHLHIEHTL